MFCPYTAIKGRPPVTVSSALDYDPHSPTEHSALCPLAVCNLPIETSIADLLYDEI